MARRAAALSRGVGFFLVGFAFLDGGCDDDAGAGAVIRVGVGVLVSAGERAEEDDFRARFVGGGVGGGVMSSCLVLLGLTRVLARRLRFRALRLGAACVVVVVAAARAIVGAWVVRMLVNSLCIDGEYAE